MKRNHIRYMLLLLPVLLLAGCQDPMDDHGPDATDAPATFTATISSAATKTLLAGQPGGTRPVYWAADDSVCIGGAIYRVSRITATDSTQAVFTGNGAQPESGKYKAFYPASLYDNRTLPAVQEYGAINSETKRTNIAHLPMYAESDSTSLTFHNLCTVLNVRLSSGNSSAKVTKVVVTSSDKYLSGPFDNLQWNNGNPTFEMSGTAAADKKVTLDCGTSGVSLGATPTEFCIAIPAGTYDQYDLTIKVYNGDTEIASFTNLDGSGTVLNRSEILDLEKPTTMRFSVRPTSSTSTLILPFAPTATWPAAVEIAWGDGNTTKYTAGSPAAVSHQYTDTESHEVKINILGIDAVIPPIVPNDNIRQMLRAWLSPLPRMDTEDGSKMFMGCSVLSAVPSDLFANNPQLVNLDSLFFDCQSLSTIPKELFSYCPELTSLAYAFYNSQTSGYPRRISLSAVADLFAGCPKLENLSHAFAGGGTATGAAQGSIPPDLFASCPVLKDVSYLFYGCTRLTGPIPDNLFANKKEVTSFERTFAFCEGLTDLIPENLFAGCTAATNFYMTFWNCTKLREIPAGLFAGCTAAESFKRTFGNCRGLTGIGDGLFAGCTAAKSFDSTFDQCTNLTGIGDGLFAGCTAATSFEKTFNQCTGLTGPIPGNLFTGCTAAESFEKTFFECSATGPIPGNLFADCTAAKSFRSTFASCQQLSGISAGLFANNTEVEDFGYVFARTRMTGEIPSGLFENNLKAYRFDYAFYGCSKNLKLRSDIFTGTTYTPETRFAGLTSAVDFSGCFAGYWYEDPNTHAVVIYAINSGTAPELWNYTYPASKKLFGECDPSELFNTIASEAHQAENGVFSPDFSTGLTNFSAIPAAWQEPRNPPRPLP